MRTHEAGPSSSSVLDLAQATLFRRNGFVVPIVLRTAFYLLWHVVYVH